MKRGAIPEFVPVKDINELYQIFTEANIKNRILESNLVDGGIESSPLKVREEKETITSFDQESVDLKNITDDLILMQFNLVRKDMLSVWNTISFLNLPSSKSSDINFVTL